MLFEHRENFGTKVAPVIKFRTAGSGFTDCNCIAGILIFGSLICKTWFFLNLNVKNKQLESIALFFLSLENFFPQCYTMQLKVFIFIRTLQTNYQCVL